MLAQRRRPRRHHCDPRWHSSTTKIPGIGIAASIRTLILENTRAAPPRPSSRRAPVLKRRGVCFYRGGQTPTFRRGAISGTGPRESMHYGTPANGCRRTNGSPENRVAFTWSVLAHERASAGLYPGHSLADLTISTSGSKFRQAQPVLVDRVEYGHSTRHLRHLKASRKPEAPRGTATDEVAWESS
jgi:hypothetical protein